jgi:catechol 2,3-dioxygenase-like lactoylglutathione lyase family enzyme
MDKEDSMTRIRHVAFYTEDPEREAQFYCDAFDLKRLRQSENGSIWLSDGYINIALIKRSKSTGINHIGFLVDNLDSAQQRLRQIMPTAEFEMPNENVTAAEFKLKDPDGNALDVSERGWAV